MTKHPAVGIAVRVALVLLILFFLGLTIEHNWSELQNFDWHFRPGWLVIAIFIFFAFQAFQAEIWGMMLRSLDHHIHPTKSRMIWNVTLLGRYVPTGTVMVVGRMTMAQREGIPKKVCLASIVYEIVLVVVAALAIGSYFVITLPSLNGNPTRFAVLIVPLVAVICLQPAIFHRFADLALRLAKRDPLPVSLSLKQVCGYLLLYVSTLLWAGFGVYALAQAIQPLDASQIPTVVSSFPIAVVAAIMAFFLPGGLGARETAMATALSPVMPFAVGITVAIAVRVLQFVIELIYAGISPLLVRRLGGPDPKVESNELAVSEARAN